MTPENKRSREIMWEGRFLRMVKQNGWEFADRTNAAGGVGVLAITPEGRMLLVEEFRVPVGAPTIMMPAGLAGDDGGTDFAEAGRRELLEETGWAADEMEYLMHGPPSAGMNSEVIYIYRARGLRRVNEGGGVEGEQIIVHEVDLRGIEGWLRGQMAAGKLIDPKVWAGLYFLMRDGDLPRP